MSTISTKNNKRALECEAPEAPEREEKMARTVSAETAAAIVARSLAATEEVEEAPAKGAAPTEEAPAADREWIEAANELAGEVRGLVPTCTLSFDGLETDFKDLDQSLHYACDALEGYVRGNENAAPDARLEEAETELDVAEYNLDRVANELEELKEVLEKYEEAVKRMREAIEKLKAPKAGAKARQTD